MTICDLCRKNVPTKIYAFGKVITEWRNLPNWDLCDECQKKILDTISTLITEGK